MKFSSEEHAILIVHDRMRRATENMMHYLQAQRFDEAVQEKLWNELRDAKKELWSLIERRPRPTPSNHRPEA